MTIFTANQAVQAVADHNASLAQLTLEALIQEFQYVFDQIQSASTSGSTSTVFTFSKYTYNRILSLLTTTGYTVSSLPTDGVAASNQIMQYPITIQWGVQISQTIYPAITDIAPATVSAPVNTYLSVSFAVVGGTSPFTWALTGKLAPGLAFDTVSGVLSGTPTVIATEYNTTTISVIDSQGRTRSQPIGISITPPTVPTSIQLLPDPGQTAALAQTKANIFLALALG
jgi:hypothetical protein